MALTHKEAQALPEGTHLSFGNEHEYILKRFAWIGPTFRMELERVADGFLTFATHHDLDVMSVVSTPEPSQSSDADIFTDANQKDTPEEGDAAATPSDMAEESTEQPSDADAEEAPAPDKPTVKTKRK